GKWLGSAIGAVAWAQGAGRVLFWMFYICRQRKAQPSQRKAQCGSIYY
ncbi:hypothetical protein A2U01_0062860, partial [Trifolium medium]|nr:hypothetical protein [Trifolium medium]